MQVRVTENSTNPKRPFMLEVKGADGNWAPFGNEPSREAADRSAKLMSEMYGAEIVSE